MPAARLRVALVGVSICIVLANAWPLVLHPVLGIGLGPTSVALITDRVFHDDKALP